MSELVVPDRAPPLGVRFRPRRNRPHDLHHPRALPPPLREVRRVAGRGQEPLVVSYRKYPPDPDWTFWKILGLGLGICVVAWIFSQAV